MAKYAIYSGPDKFEVMLALFDCKQVTFLVTMNGRECDPFDVTLVAMNREGGVSGSWFFGGYHVCREAKYEITLVYNFETRKGWLDQ